MSTQHLVSASQSTQSDPALALSSDPDTARQIWRLTGLSAIVLDRAEWPALSIPDTCLHIFVLADDYPHAQNLKSDYRRVHRYRPLDGRTDAELRPLRDCITRIWREYPQQLIAAAIAKACHGLDLSPELLGQVLDENDHEDILAGVDISPALRDVAVGMAAPVAADLELAA